MIAVVCRIEDQSGAPDRLRLAIQPVPAGDRALECQRKLALGCRENLLGSRFVKSHAGLVVGSAASVAEVGAL